MVMLRLAVTAVAVLLLVGCGVAAPAKHGQYAQGAPVPPRPPAFTPAQDAPHTVGQPGTLAPPRQYPRAPPGQRVLPETPETRRGPGLWGSTPPVASDDPDPSLTLMGVPIAAPSIPEQRSKTAWCVGQVKVAFHETAYMGRASAWLKCLANVLVKACLDAERDNIKRRADPHDAVQRERLVEFESAAALSAREVGRLCPSPPDAETATAYGGMYDTVSRISWSDR